MEIVRIVDTNIGGGARVLLFGSHAKGTETAVSDIDIAIDAGDILGFETFIKIKEAVGEIPTLRSIDIVDFNDIGESLKNSILKNSKEICMK